MQHPISNKDPSKHKVGRIMIVDDNPDNLRTLKAMLEAYGYKTFAAINGELALEALNEVQPDLVLLDIQMPNMDGYEVCQRLKANDHTREIPVLFISALHEPMDKVKAFDVGGVDYISKPFQLEEVLARVRTHIQLHQIQQHLEELVDTRTEELSKSERRLREAHHVAHIGNWELDLVIDKLYWSDEIYQIFGIEPEQFAGSYEAFLDTIHPDDRTRVAEAYTSAIESNKPYEIIHRIIRKSDGAVRHVQEFSKETRDDNGKSLRSIGTVQDITDLINAEEKSKLYHQKLEHSLEQTIQAIATTVEKRDPYTAGHQQRVANLAAAIGTEMGLDEQCLKGVHMGATIHDIGKIYVPSEILNRPGKLTEPEFTIIKAHPDVGYDILKDIEFPWPVAEIIHQHHERLDGSGYPLGLKGDEITLEARVLTVADVVEAMISHRPYRPGLGVDKALHEIEKNRGKLYEPDAVDSCIYLFREKHYNFD